MSETHYDAVIVGSGFGGSVMAYRLAEAGLKVCLLERGQHTLLAHFLAAPTGCREISGIPAAACTECSTYGHFKALNSVVSSGLGGGSLIYANVMLRKDEKWFVKEDLHHGGYEYWPVTYDDLDPITTASRK